MRFHSGKYSACDAHDTTEEPVTTEEPEPVLPDIEHAFSDANNVPPAHWFSDGLHPNTNGYHIIIVPALRKALEERNKNS